MTLIVITITCSPTKELNPRTKGNIKTNSTSKTKKINATRKNRIENGNRAPNLGVNPHSKGLVFSKSGRTFIPKEQPKPNTKSTKTAAEIKTQIKNNIPVWQINALVLRTEYK
jgi:hypothetical protein